jgi:hypothetical protein
MRGVPYPATPPRDDNRHAFTRLQVSSIATDHSTPPASAIPSPEDLLRQVWAARPPCWQSGDQALANALCDVRAFLIRNGDIA